MSKEIEALEIYLDKRIKDIKNYLKLNERSEDEKDFTPAKELQICYLAKRMLAIANVEPSEAMKEIFDKVFDYGVQSVLDSLLLRGHNTKTMLEGQSFAKTVYQDLDEAKVNITNLETIKNYILKLQEQEKEFKDAIKLNCKWADELDYYEAILSIIKEKKINVEQFYLNFVKSGFGYHYFLEKWYKFQSTDSNKLTQEEFDLLKEMLSNE